MTARSSTVEQVEFITLQILLNKFVFLADRNVFVDPFFVFGSENGYKAKS